jgi:hypothetical protein
MELSIMLIILRKSKIKERITLNVNLVRKIKSKKELSVFLMLLRKSKVKEGIFFNVNLTQK